MVKSENNSEKKLTSEDLAVRESVIEDLFYDFYRDRKKIYNVNFFRGVFFGFGTFLGGTVVIAILILVLTWVNSVLPQNLTVIDWFLKVITKQ